MRRRLLLFVATFLIATLGVFAAEASASPGAYRVLIVYGMDTSCAAPTTLQGELRAQPDVAQVDLFNANGATPTAATLDSHDLVVSMSDCSGYADNVTYGDRLADFVDQGGVVVEYAYDNESGAPMNTVQGRWASGGYAPFVGGPNTNSDSTLGTHDASNPLMRGVNHLESHDNTSPTPAAGATLVAKWADGRNLVAYKGRAVSVSAAVGDEVASHSGDFGTLTLNAVRWLGRHTLTVTRAGSGSGTVTSSPGGIACGTTCSAIYNNGTTVTLTATPASGSTFSGWTGGGCSGSGTCTVTMSAAQAVTATFTAPAVVSSSSLTHKTFRDATKPRLVTFARRRPPVGTTIKFTLDRTATVRLDFTQPGRGRKVNGRCVAQNRHNRHKRRCTRTLRRGSLTFAGHAGTNSVFFKGWLSRTHKLKPGRYTLTITAITPGVGTTSQKLSFRIVR